MDYLHTELRDALSFGNNTQAYHHLLPVMFTLNVLRSIVEVEQTPPKMSVCNKVLYFGKCIDRRSDILMFTVCAEFSKLIGT